MDLKAELERLQRKNAELETRVQADADVKAELERLRRKYAELEMRTARTSSKFVLELRGRARSAAALPFVCSGM